MLPSGPSFRPGGIVPAVAAQVYGGRPPAAFNVCEYAVWIVAGGSTDPVMMAKPEPTTSVNCWVARFAALSVTSTVNVKVPLVMGVPESCPLDGFKLMPPGGEPELTSHWYGLVPPTAVSVCE